MPTAAHQHFGPFFYRGELVTAPLLYHYLPGTTQEKQAWIDYNRGTTAANPIPGDANGVVAGYFSGLYKIRITTQDGAVLGSWDNVNFIDLDALDSSGDNVINVQEVGGDTPADGITDWTNIIQEAVSLMIAGSALYFPRGQYKVTQAFNLPAQQGMRIYGDGRSSLIRNDTSNNGIFSIAAGSHGLKIDHLKLKSVGTLSVLGRGLVYFNPDAVPVAIQNAHIHDVTFAASSTSGISGNYITDSQFTWNVFDNEGLAYGEHGLYFGTSGGSSARNDISHNILRNLAGGNSGGITIAGQQEDHTVVGNRIFGWKYGILINDTADGSLHDTLFSSLRIKGQSHDGIIFFQSDTVEPPTALEFSDILITETGRNGIRSDWVEKSTFNNVQILRCDESGARMNTMTYCHWDNCVLVDNDFNSDGAGGDDSAGLRLNTDCAHNRFNGLETRCTDVLVGQSYGVSIGGSGNTDNNFANHISGPNRVGDFDVSSAATGTWTWADGDRCFKVGNPGTTFTQIYTGSGSPESVVTAPVGALYLRSDGSTSTTLYVKTSGSGSSGWTAK